VSAPLAIAAPLTRRCALAACLVPWASGCATTSIATQWKAEAFAGPPLRKLLVLALTRQAAPRRVFEDTYVAALRDNGTSAIASHTLIAQDGPVEREVVVKAVRDSGADGVLVARLVGREAETRRDTQLEMVPMRSLHPGLGHAWVRVYEVREREVIHAIAETSVYRASDGALVWTAITDSVDPTNLQSATRGFSRATIGALKKGGVL
jgi:hypothetical protein